MLYGSADRVIPPDEAASWINIILSQEWHDPRPVAAALAQMARKTGDRVRDIAPAVSLRVIEWMSQYDFSEPYITMLKTVVHIEKQEQNMLFGESLPSGIVLHA